MSDRNALLAALAVLALAACGGTADTAPSSGEAHNIKYVEHDGGVGYGGGFTVYCDTLRHNLIYQDNDGANIAVVPGGC